MFEQLSYCYIDIEITFDMCNIVYIKNYFSLFKIIGHNYKDYKKK